MIRDASEIAKSALAGLGAKTATLSQTQAPTAFAEVLSSEASTAKAGEGEPISRIREKLAKAVSESLGSLDVSLDPALTFVVGENGQLQLEGAHPQAAEIEAKLRDNSEIQLLAARLLESPNVADRRLVLHSVTPA
jgi:hypothetical protein